MRIRGSINEAEDGQDGYSHIIVTIANGEGLAVVENLPDGVWPRENGKMVIETSTRRS